MSDAPQAERRHWVFWPLALAGWAVMAYALVGLFQHHRDTNPGAVFRTVVALDLVHDLVIAPMVVVVGVILARVVPPAARRPVVTGLVVSAVTALYAYPLVAGYGRSAATPSRLPDDYGAGLAWVLAAVWAAVGASIVFAVVRARRAS